MARKIGQKILSGTSQKMAQDFVDKMFGHLDNFIDELIPEEAANNVDYKERDTQTEFNEFIESMKAQAQAANDKVGRAPEDERPEEGDIEPEKIKLSYSVIQAQMNKAASVISEEYDVILCITRGGLIPAGMLAYQLDIKDIVSVKIESYSDADLLVGSKVTKMSKRDIKKLKNAKRVLVVDDIVDSGSTLIALHKYLAAELKMESDDLNKKYSTFSIVTKDIAFNDYSIYNMTGDERWVVFPWDK